VLFDQVGKGFVHKRLKLSAMLLSKAAHGGQDFGMTWVANFSRLWA